MNQRGMALLIVLLMVATMAAVAVSSQTYWMQAFSRAESQQFRQQAKWTLLGAEEWVRLQQLENLSKEAVHAGQPWAAGWQHFALGGVRVDWQLIDNQACFNLNTLTRPEHARPGRHDTPGHQPASPSTMAARGTPSAALSEAPAPREALPQRVFRQLLLDQGVAFAQASAMTNALTAMTPLTDVSQLRALPGVERPLWQRLQPLVCTAAAKQQRLNVNTLRGEAGAWLLMALSQGHLSRQQAERRLTARPAEGWPEASDIFGEAVSDGAAAAFAEAVSLIGLSSNDMTLQLHTEQDAHRYQLQSRLQRTEDNGFRVTERRYGFTDLLR